MLRISQVLLQGVIISGSKSNCYNTIESSDQETNDLAHGDLVMRKLYFPSIHLSMRYGSPWCSNSFWGEWQWNCVITNINAKFAFSITGWFFPGGSNRAKTMINGLTTMLYIKYSVKTQVAYVLKWFWEACQLPKNVDIQLNSVYNFLMYLSQSDVLVLFSNAVRHLRI